MRHIKLFENFEQLKVSISKKTDENWQLIKNEFPDIPITLEQYLERPHILMCEARIGDELVGASIFVVKDFKANVNEIAIPEDIDYKLPRVHMNYTAILETHRKSGIGKAIKLAVVEYCESIGAGIVTANIRVDNIASQKLSLSCGWQKSDKLTSNGFNTFYKVLNN